jgi:transcriptional regulator with PAS, ATPase and Fis domain
MPIDLQTKLLRVLQEQEFYRVGGNIPIKVDLRIVSMTNKNIKNMIKNGEFRKDLFFRIGHFIIDIPPLRERKDDIIPLISYFIEKTSKEQNKNCGGFTKPAISYLKKYNWPGNVRQLENTINLIMSLINHNETVDENLIKEELKIENDTYDTQNIPEIGKEKTELLKILKKNLWHKTRTAKELEISRTALYKRMKKYGINVKQ